MAAEGHLLTDAQKNRHCLGATCLPSPWGRVGDGGSAVRGQGVISGVAPPSPDPFPLAKGSLIACNRDLLRDHLQYPVDIPQHLVVPETDHAVAVGFDDARAVRVGGAGCVLSAVEFDGEAQGSAGEVGDEVADGELPRELHALEAARAQVQPQALPGVGRLIPQFSREACQSLFRHCRTPIPNPFPQGKGLLPAKST